MRLRKVFVTERLVTLITMTFFSYLFTKCQWDSMTHWHRKVRSEVLLSMQCISKKKTTKAHTDVGRRTIKMLCFRQTMHLYFYNFLSFWGFKSSNPPQHWPSNKGKLNWTLLLRLMTSWHVCLWSDNVCLSFTHDALSVCSDITPCCYLKPPLLLSKFNQLNWPS